MPLLLRDNARTNSFGRTRRKSTSRGTLTPCRAPMLLIQLHRLLCRWAAIIPTVSREMPGTCLDQTAGGRCSTRYVVARLFVRHAAMIARPGPSSLGTSAPSIRPSNVRRTPRSPEALRSLVRRRQVHLVVRRRFSHAGRSGCVVPRPFAQSMSGPRWCNDPGAIPIAPAVMSCVMGSKVMPIASAPAWRRP